MRGFSLCKSTIKSFSYEGKWGIVSLLVMP